MQVTSLITYMIFSVICGGLCRCHQYNALDYMLQCVWYVKPIHVSRQVIANCFPKLMYLYWGEWVVLDLSKVWYDWELSFSTTLYSSIHQFPVLPLPNPLSFSLIVRGEHPRRRLDSRVNWAVNINFHVHLVISALQINSDTNSLL